MGAGQSTNSTQLPKQALHILRVTPSSPASQTDIEPFFDFVIGFDGDTLSSQNSIDVQDLERIVEMHEGKSLNLMVWNSKNSEARIISIVPSRDWAVKSPPTTGHDPNEPQNQPSLLGLTMRVCEPEFALDNVWHVLDVLEGSPAESAGLVPYGDWIVGWSGGVLSAEGDFYDLIEAHVEKPLRVYVYSHDFDALREVVLIPNRHWGGEGLLGCVFGFGLLHRIPPRDPAEHPATPPELAYDEHEQDYEEQQLFVPADTSADYHFNPTWEQERQFVAESGILSPSALAVPSHPNPPPGDSTSSFDHEQHQHGVANDHIHRSGGDGDVVRPSMNRIPSSFSGASASPSRGPFGAHINGSGPSPLHYNPRSAAGDATPRRSSVRAPFSGNESDSNDGDESTSVSGTEVSRARSGSRGSLTSVD